MNEVNQIYPVMKLFYLTEQSRQQKFCFCCQLKNWTKRNSLWACWELVDGLVATLLGSALKGEPLPLSIAIQSIGLPKTYQSSPLHLNSSASVFKSLRQNCITSTYTWQAVGTHCWRNDRIYHILAQTSIITCTYVWKCKKPVLCKNVKKNV